MNLNEAVELLDKHLTPQIRKGAEPYVPENLPLFDAWKVVKKAIVGHELSALNEAEITPDEEEFMKLLAKADKTFGSPEG